MKMNQAKDRMYAFFPSTSAGRSKSWTFKCYASLTFLSGCKEWRARKEGELEKWVIGLTAALWGRASSLRRHSFGPSRALAVAESPRVLPALSFQLALLNKLRFEALTYPTATRHCYDCLLCSLVKCFVLLMFSKVNAEKTCLVFVWMA